MTTRRLRPALGTALLAACLVAVPVGLVQPAGAAVAGQSVSAASWAPAASATIRPGVQMLTDGAQCTANFVFTDSSARVYVGYAAHCAGLGEATDTDGCKAKSLPLGTRVTFEREGGLVTGGERVGRGTLVYSSWLTMQRLRTTNADACAYNDFALVRVDRADLSKVNPTVPFWGGPTGLAPSTSDLGDQVYTYGNSSLRGGYEQLSPKTGVSDGVFGGGWTHGVYTATPGIPGDSGSGFLDAQGRAMGVLSTLNLLPFPGENGVSDLGKALSFAQRHSGISGLKLVKGTQPFAGLG